MELVLASHNKGKLVEIRELVEGYDLDISSAADYDLSEPEETETTFEGNARIKAHYCAKQTGKLSISDDSGLEIAALDGAPGVYTADWAETENGRDFYMAMEKTRVALIGKTAPFLANFTSVLCLAWPDGRDMVFRGEVHGHLEFPPRGKMGFGYDPVFVPEGYTNTFAELPAEVKNKISHRARAFEALLAAKPFE